MRKKTIQRIVVKVILFLQNKLIIISIDGKFCNIFSFCHIAVLRKELFKLFEAKRFVSFKYTFFSHNTQKSRFHKSKEPSIAC